jgi:hypothetical protein
VREGKNDREALRFAVSGQLVGVQGELELHVRVEPPESPEVFTSRCHLVLNYGSRRTTVDLPITVEFQGGELTPDVQAVVFSAASPGELKGQERLVQISSRDGGRDVEIQNVPAWLAWEVISRSGVVS